MCRERSISAISIPISPPADDDTPGSIPGVSFHVFQILQTVQPPHPLQVLTRPVKLIEGRPGSDDQFVVLNIFARGGKQFLLFRIHFVDIRLEQLDPVLVPKMVFIRFDVFEPGMAHVDIHQSSTGVEIPRFGRDHRDAVVAHLADVAGSGDACDPISNYDNVLHRSSKYTFS